MYSECRHILPSGRKCHSPALKGQVVCYFHHRLESVRLDGTRADKEPLKLPSLEDARGIQMALTQILSALGSGRINPKLAAVYLSGIRLALQALKHAAAPAPIETVRALDQCDRAGTYIGPEQTHCDPYVDCATCKTKDTCLNAARLNMRSMHQILRAVHRGQDDLEKNLDEAQNPTSQESFEITDLRKQLETAERSEQAGQSHPGPSAGELQYEIDWLLDREAENKNESLAFRELIDPGHLYNFRRAAASRH